MTKSSPAGTRPTVGSLFSGIGGFDLGLERAGWDVRWQIEIEAFRRDLLERHWPGVPRLNDITTIDPGELTPVDLVCGGFPCQDVSVAGARKGLAGERSGLFFQYARIVGALRPRWILIENVPGLLSSNDGQDFAIVLGTLGDLGYWWTYRTLDAQYFGVAQRRRRVFIVGHLGSPCPPEILFDAAGRSGDPPPRNEKETLLAPGLRKRFDGSDRGGDVAYAIRRDPGGIGQGWNTNYVGDTLGAHHPRDNQESTYVVARALTTREGRRHDASLETHVVAGTVTGSEAHNGQSNPVPGNYVLNGRQDPVTSVDKSLALDAGRPQHVVAIRTVQTGSNGANVTEDVAHTIDGARGAANIDAVAFGPSNRPGYREWHEIDQARALNSQSRGVGGQSSALIGQTADADRVREATRVPGSLDPTTADTKRYEALGDAVAVPVAQWIGKRLLRAHREPENATSGEE